MANDNDPQEGTSTAAAVTKTYNRNTYTKTTPTDDFKGEVMGPATDGVVPVKMKRGTLGTFGERRYAELKLSDYPDLMGAKVGDEFEIKVKRGPQARPVKHTPDASFAPLMQIVKAAPKTVNLKTVVSIAAGADAVLQHVFQLSQEEQSRRTPMVNVPPFATSGSYTQQRANMLEYLNKADTSAADAVALFDLLMTDNHVSLQPKMSQFVEILPRMDDQAKAAKILQGMCREVAGQLGDGARKLDEKCKLLKVFFNHMEHLGEKSPNPTNALPQTPQSQQNTADLKIALFREIAKVPRIKANGLCDVLAVLP